MKTRTLDLPVEAGPVLIALFKARGISQLKMAGLLRLSESVVNGWNTGREGIKKFEHAQRALELLDLDWSDLIEACRSGAFEPSFRPGLELLAEVEVTTDLRWWLGFRTLCDIRELDFERFRSKLPSRTSRSLSKKTLERIWNGQESIDVRVATLFAEILEVEPSEVLEIGQAELYRLTGNPKDRLALDRKTHWLMELAQKLPAEQRARLAKALAESENKTAKRRRGRSEEP